MCHTHLAETLDEERFCLQHFGMRPIEYAESLGWLADDCWFAHCVHLDPREIASMAATGTGVAHCPCSNMRLASGIAPVVAMANAGVHVGLGVDGSASNDSEHLLAEARQALLLQRVGTGDASAFKVRQALELATRGGADVLGRDDIGRLAPGTAADVVGWRLATLPYAGALKDPVAALVLCQPQNVDFAVVNGVERVRGGEIVDLDLPRLVHEHNELPRRLGSARRIRLEVAASARATATPNQGTDQGLPRARRLAASATFLATPTDNKRTPAQRRPAVTGGTMSQLATPDQSIDQLGLGAGAVPRDRTHAVFGQVMGLVALTVGCAALGAYLGRDLTGGVGIAFFIGAFACIIGLNVASGRGHEQLAMGLLFGLGLLLGLAVAPVLAYYAKMDPAPLWQAAGTTAAFVAALGSYGYATRCA